MLCLELENLSAAMFTDIFSTMLNDAIKSPKGN